MEGHHTAMGLKEEGDVGARQETEALGIRRISQRQDERSQL